MKNMLNDKYLGINGSTKESYLSFWNEIKDAYISSATAQKNESFH